MVSPSSPQSPDIGQNSDWGIFNFWISGQSFITENRHNSRTNYDINMKLGSVTKLDKTKMTTSKKIGNDVMSANCGIIYFFWFMANFQPSETWIPDLGSIKLTFSLIITFCLTKAEKKNYKNSNTALILLLWVKAPFLWKKCWFFAKNTDISKIKKITSYIF